MMSLNGEKTGAGLLGLVSAWIDPDSESAAIRQASTAAFRAEVEWAKFIGLQAIALPPPHDTLRAAGYAQVNFEPQPSWIWLKIRVCSETTASTYDSQSNCCKHGVSTA
jgi:hypothetical protein